ncbi:MAG: hypothetical protein Q9192_004109 [Flavoplaca navasiana]
MGDHVCAKVPILPDLAIQPFNLTFKPASASATASKRRPSKGPPVRINAPLASEYTLA